MRLLYSRHIGSQVCLLYSRHIGSQVCLFYIRHVEFQMCLPYSRHVEFQVCLLHCGQIHTYMNVFLVSCLTDFDVLLNRCVQFPTLLIFEVFDIFINIRNI